MSSTLAVQQLSRRKAHCGKVRSKANQVIKDPEDGISEAVLLRGEEDLECLETADDDELGTQSGTSKEITDNGDSSSQASRGQLKQNREDDVDDRETFGCNRKTLKMDACTSNETTNSSDWISTLPEQLIHHILSLLRSPKEVARATTLSKQWREICSSYTILMFDQRKFTKAEKHTGSSKRQEFREKTEVFMDFAFRSLQTRLQGGYHMEKIQFHMTYCDFDYSSRIDNWLSLVAKSNVRELDLHFPHMDNGPYNLPQSLFTSSAITRLKLFNCKLGTLEEIKLPNLRGLCLGKLYISDSRVRDLIRCCPLIKDLRLIHCIGLKKLHVSGLAKLDKLEVHCCPKLKSIQVEAPNLQTFFYCIERHKPGSWPFDLSSATCRSLKSIALKNAELTDEMFQALLNNCPLLETLELSKCNSLESVAILSKVLRRLVLRQCRILNDAEINAPNLCSLKFEGNKMPSLSLLPSDLKEVKITLRKNVWNLLFGIEDLLWSHNWRLFLGKINHSRGMKLVLHCEENVIIHEDLRYFSPPPMKNLDLEIVDSSRGFKNVLESSLRTWHPKTVIVVSSPGSTLPKLAHGLLMERDNHLSCCGFVSFENKCWRHFLENVNTLDIGLAGDERTSSWMSLFKSSPALLLKSTGFTLDWKSRKRTHKVNPPGESDQ
ncbi:uncharacterized protein LOC115737336 [Rhodamnia argentea]|uniref:Uncharacterized protein LOC115737336 n=1 Tax=Rhodamnia argentea TaxID=178133 RepID=A0ABM3H061_9MYRT|nr:uncharacterized protein LOC115737336 [Rhodamnia argentea]XP_048129974.1 uncharacterized protein LOC115737336 [Rhodamnia argentea]